jgi:hypothetical protein
VDISDPIAILSYLFDGTQTLSCRDAADGNDDGEINIADPVRILMFLFRGADALPPPAESPGVDPTEDAIGCGATP